MQNREELAKEDILREIKKLKDDFIDCILSFTREIHPHYVEFTRKLLDSPQAQQERIKALVRWNEEWQEQHPLSKRFYAIRQKFDNLRGRKYLREVLTYPVQILQDERRQQVLPDQFQMYIGGRRGVLVPYDVLLYIDYQLRDFWRNPGEYATFISFLADVLEDSLECYIKKYQKRIFPIKELSHTKKDEKVAKTVKEDIGDKTVNIGDISGSPKIVIQLAGKEAKQKVTINTGQDEKGWIKSYLPFVSPIIEFFKLIFSFFKPSGQCY
ncbi:MAG: hypothetical protein ACUZ77_09595 [Candidatus Brocadiales bacterium]